VFAVIERVDSIDDLHATSSSARVYATLRTNRASDLTFVRSFSCDTPQFSAALRSRAARIRLRRSLACYCMQSVAYPHVFASLRAAFSVHGPLHLPSNSEIRIHNKMYRYRIYNYNIRTHRCMTIMYATRSCDIYRKRKQ